MNKNFNINMLNQNSSVKVTSRGEIKEDIKMYDKFGRGDITIPKGAKGWLEWNYIHGFVFELDEPIKYPRWIGSLYRLCYNKKSKKFKRQIKCYEASNDERIEYLTHNINIKRSCRGLKEINPGNIRFALNMALVNNLDLEMAVQTYLDDIEIEAKAI